MGWGTPTNIGTASDVSSAATVQLSSVTVPAGSLIVVCATEGSTTAGWACADGASNSYVMAASQATGDSGAETVVFYARNSKALSSSTITFTKGRASDNTVISAFYVSGALASATPLDLSASTSGTSASPSLASGTPANSNELFVGIVGWESSVTTFTQAASWAAPPNAISAIVGAEVAGGYLIGAVTGTAAQTYAPTLSGSVPWAEIVLSFIAAEPSPNYDWPPPKGPQPGVISLRTISESVKLNLIGNDTFFGAPGDGPTYDYPNPRAPLYPIGPMTTWANSIEQNQNLVGKDQFFGAAGEPSPNYDWPVPRGYVPGVSLRTWIYPPSTNIASVQPFFGAPGQFPTYDWPNPRGPLQGGIDLRTWIQRLSIQLLGKDQFFGAPGTGSDYDYPNPRGPSQGAIAAKTHIDLHRSFLPDQGFEAPGQPFENYDWPVPRGYVHGISLRTHTDPLRIQLQGKDVLPNGPGSVVYDYPNPRGRVWPNDRGWVGQLPINLVNQDGFFGPPGSPPTYDWPNPKGAQRGSISLATWAYPVTLSSLGKDTFFAGPGVGPDYDWPNPRGPVHGAITLKTWVDCLKLELAGQDKFFSGAGTGPDYDYPNPRGPSRSTDSFDVDPADHVPPD